MRKVTQWKARPVFSARQVVPTDVHADPTEALAFDDEVCALTVIRIVDELVHETHGHTVSSRHGEEHESRAAGIHCEAWHMQSVW